MQESGDGEGGGRRRRSVLTPVCDLGLSFLGGSDPLMELGSICFLLIGSWPLPCWTARTGPPVGQDI
jgi:hypothetical protein